jgi:hypothetical protein
VIDGALRHGGPVAAMCNGVPADPTTPAAAAGRVALACFRYADSSILRRAIDVAGPARRWQRVNAQCARQ